MPGFTWFAVALIVTVAAALQALTGFGFALVSLPFMLFLYAPHEAVGLNIILSLLSQTLLTMHVRSVIIGPLVRNLFLGSLVGMPLGFYVYARSDVNLLKLLISAVVLLFSILNLVGRVPPRAGGRSFEIGIGSLSGFLGSSVGMPGPPVVLYLFHQGLPKEGFRATASGFFTTVYFLSLLLFLLSGALDIGMGEKALSLVPFLFAGQIVGYRLFPCIPQAQFKKGVLLLVMATSLYSFLTTLFQV